MGHMSECPMSGAMSHDVPSKSGAKKMGHVGHFGHVGHMSMSQKAGVVAQKKPWANAQGR